MYRILEEINYGHYYDNHNSGLIAYIFTDDVDVYYNVHREFRPVFKFLKSKLCNDNGDLPKDAFLLKIYTSVAAWEREIKFTKLNLNE